MKFTISLNVLAPVLIILWYFTQNETFITALAVVTGIGIVLNTMAFYIIAVIIPKLPNVKFVEAVLSMREAHQSPLKYFAYISMFSVLAALIYFGHQQTAALAAISIALGLSVRMITGSIIKKLSGE